MALGPRSRGAWRWIVAVALLALGGGAGSHAATPPAPNTPAGRIDQFSGYPTRGC